jgi:hypothetical protein
MVSIAFGWSSDSHKITAKLAASVLSRKARRYVLRHLGDIDDTSFKSRMNRIQHALVSVSGWADHVDWSSELHFSNTPNENCQPFDLSRDCPNGRCIVTAIANYTERASDYLLPKSDRGEALKFLVHLVADIHSPMHVAFAKDFGGNRIGIQLPSGENDVLHEVWDYRLLDTFKGDSDVRWYQLLDRFPQITKALVQPSIEGSPLERASEIASETATQFTCEYGYKDENGQWIRDNAQLSREYMETRGEVAFSQIVKSASRLAQFIEHVASKYFAAEVAVLAEQEQERAGKTDVVPANRFEPLRYLDEIEEAVYEVDDLSTEPVEEEVAPSISVTTTPADEIVLIRRGASYYITRKSFVVSDEWRPLMSTSVYLRYQNGLYLEIPIAVDLLGPKAHSVPNERILEILTDVFGDLASLNLTLERVAQDDDLEGIFGVMKNTKHRDIRFDKVPYNPDMEINAPTKAEVRSHMSKSRKSPAGLSPYESFAVDSLNKRIEDLAVFHGRGVMLVSSLKLMIQDSVNERTIDPITRNPRESRFFLRYTGIDVDSLGPREDMQTFVLLLDSRVFNGGPKALEAAIASIFKFLASPANDRNTEFVQRAKSPLYRAFISLNNIVIENASPKSMDNASLTLLGINHVSHETTFQSLPIVEIVVKPPPMKKRSG